MNDEVKAVLRAVKQEKARTVLVFEKDGNEMPISAFEPNLPKLTIGNTYEFVVAHVPMPDGIRFYHNLFREAKDKPYQIKEAAQAPQPVGVKSLNDLIIRQTCLKVAGEIVAMSACTEKLDYAKAEEEVKRLTRIFEKFVKEVD
jgi:hypothetical protein